MSFGYLENSSQRQYKIKLSGDKKSSFCRLSEGLKFNILGQSFPNSDKG